MSEVSRYPAQAHAPWVISRAAWRCGLAARPTPGGGSSWPSAPSGCWMRSCSTSPSCSPGPSARCSRPPHAGNPALVASPILWNAHLVGQHPVPLNAVFATIQLLLALGIAWRPTVRLALGASVGWALGVWWFGEGLGGC